MNAYTDQVPAGRRAPDWRAAGACRRPEFKGRAELWFALGNDRLAREIAEQACRRCPSLEPCGVWAVLEGIEDGTWGALHEEQRRSLRRRLTPEQRKDPVAVALAVREALDDPDGRARTLHAIWQERTYTLPDGHLGWRHKQTVDYGGRSYTKRQIGFYVSRGEMPFGSVLATCGVKECVLPAHIADQMERNAAKARAAREAVAP